MIRVCLRCGRELALCQRLRRLEHTPEGDPCPVLGLRTDIEVKGRR